MTARERDYQRQKVYDWERVSVPSGRFIPFAEIPGYVAEVWSAYGRVCPPLIQTVPKNARRIRADGCRGVLRFNAKGEVESVILHELAHALTSNVDDTGDWHGPAFVGWYMKLLADNIKGTSLFALWYSAERANLDFERKL